MRIGKGRAEHQELAKADGFTGANGETGANGDRSNIRLFGKGFAEPSTENKLSSPDRSALGFYLTCLQSSLSRLFDLSPTQPLCQSSSFSSSSSLSIFERRSLTEVCVEQRHATGCVYSLPMKSRTRTTTTIGGRMRQPSICSEIHFGQIGRAHV